MRRLAQSDKKLRNIPRRQRALARWADGFAGQTFAQHADERFCHWKIPVHLHMVQGRQTTPELQTFCIQQLMIAAQHLQHAAPKNPSQGYYRVACLIVWPYLHQSEVTIFYDDQYYQCFINTTQPLPQHQLFAHLAIDLPQDWQAIGVDVTQPDDEQAVSWWILGPL